MENEEVKTSVMSQFDNIISFDTSILRQTKFDSFQFEGVESTILLFQDLVAQLSQVDDFLIEELPNYSEVISLFKKVQVVLQKIYVHSKIKDSPPEFVEDIKEEIITCYKDLYRNHANLITLLHVPRAGKYISSLKDKIKEMEGIISDIRAKDAQAEELLKVLNQRIADVDVSRYSSKFQISSKNYKSFAKWWLAASIFLFSVTIGILFGYNELFSSEDKNSTFELVRYLSTKLLILTLLISATLWSAKIYKVNKNLSVVYEHKSNSLDTFTEFVNSAQSAETKDFVLQETTKAIFTLPESGLIGFENLPVQSLSKVIDLAKSTVGKS